jgi:hypothetical protein
MKVKVIFWDKRDGEGLVKDSSGKCGGDLCL